MKTAVLLGLSLFALLMLVSVVFKDELTDKPRWTEIPTATTPHRTLALDDDALSRGRFGAIASVVVVFGEINGPGLVILTLAGVRARRPLRHAGRDSEVATTGDSIVSGDVEAVDADPSPVIEVRVRQAGSEQSFKGTTFQYDLLVIDGETVQAPLDGRRAWKEWVSQKYGRPHEVTRTEVRAMAELGTGERVAVWGACSNEFYDAVMRGSYDAVPVVVSKHFRGTYQLGFHPGVSLVASATALGLLTVVWVLLWMVLKGLRPAEPGAPINDEATGPLDVFTNLKRPF